MWVVCFQSLLYLITIGVLAVPAHEKAGITDIQTCIDDCTTRGLSLERCGNMCNTNSVSKKEDNRGCMISCLQANNPKGLCDIRCHFNGRKRSVDLDSLKDKSIGYFKGIHLDRSRLLPDLSRSASRQIPEDVRNQQNQYANSDDVSESVYPIVDHAMGQRWQQDMNTNRYQDGDSMIRPIVKKAFRRTILRGLS